jgi:GT2 family glycosyltransferase
MLRENTSRIYIVIPVFNRLQFTAACLQSLCEQEYEHYVIVLVDHGSTDGTAEYVQQHFPSVVLLKGDESMWWTAATNLGLRYALDHNADYILTLNNDLVVKKDYLLELMKVMQNRQDLIIGSASVDIANPEKVAYAGTRWNPWLAKYRHAVSLDLPYSNLIAQNDLIATDLLPGRGTLVPAAAFRTAGLYDENNFPHYAADEDFSLRARKQGCRLAVCPRAVVMSHVAATGIGKEKLSWSYLVRSFSSIKSPKNLKIRWRWAIRHARTPAPFYFMMDVARLLKSTLTH